MKTTIINDLTPNTFWRVKNASGEKVIAEFKHRKNAREFKRNLKAEGVSTRIFRVTTSERMDTHS